MHRVPTDEKYLRSCEKWECSICPSWFSSPGSSSFARIFSVYMDYTGGVLKHDNLQIQEYS